MISLLELHFQLLVIQFPCLLLLAFYELLFLVVAVPYFLVVVHLFLHALSNLDAVGAGYLLRILILSPLLIGFNRILPMLLLRIVLTNSTQALIIILYLINFHLSLSNSFFQVD